MALRGDSSYQNDHLKCHVQVRTRERCGNTGMDLRRYKVLGMVTRREITKQKKNLMVVSCARLAQSHELHDRENAKGEPQAWHSVGWCMKGATNGVRLLYPAEWKVISGVCETQRADGGSAAEYQKQYGGCGGFV